MNYLYFSPFPILTADELILRQLNIEDENEIFILRSDERVLKYLGKAPAKSIDEARQFIEKINSGIAENQWIYWAISQKDNPGLIGTICLWNFNEDNTSAEIGFELLPDFFGRGIIQQVLPVVLDYSFQQLGLQAIEGEVSPDNIKSIKLMEKYGFVYNRKQETTAVYRLKKSSI